MSSEPCLFLITNFQSDHHVALCWLVECTMSRVSFSWILNQLNTESVEYWIRLYSLCIPTVMIVICLLRLQPTSRSPHQWMYAVTFLNVLLRSSCCLLPHYKPLACDESMAVFSQYFLHRILIVTFSLQKCSGGGQLQTGYVVLMVRLRHVLCLRNKNFSTDR